MTWAIQKRFHIAGKDAGSSSNVKETSGTGTHMQGFNPGNYIKKRLQLTAWAKSKNAKDWAGIWFRVDTKKEMTLAFDWTRISGQVIRTSQLNSIEIE